MPSSPARPVHRRRRLERRLLPVGAIALLAFAVGIVKGATHVPAEQRVAERFAEAWSHADYAAMRAELTPEVQRTTDAAALAKAYRDTAAVATTRSYEIGKPRKAGEDYALPVVAHTGSFGDVRGTVRLPLDGDGEDARVAWTPNLTFPDVPAGARLERTTRLPERAAIL